MSKIIELNQQEICVVAGGMGTATKAVIGVAIVAGVLVVVIAVGAGVLYVGATGFCSLGFAFLAPAGQQLMRKLG